jgi:colanic acid/amylovoran biosynthesis protein
VSTYAVIGATLWGNRGAEAMVATTIGRVRERDPQARFLLMSYLAGDDRTLIDDPTVSVLDAAPERTVLVHLPAAVVCWLLGLVGLRLPDRLLPAPVRALRRCRALFDVSGISFHDGRLAVVAYNIMCVWPALLLGVPVVRLSQAMGPFRHPLNRLPARWVTARSAHTFARGRHTADHLRAVGMPAARWSVAPDVAFAYRPEDSLTVENDRRVEDVVTRLGEHRSAGASVVAVVPSSLVLAKISTDGGDYILLLRDLVADLQARGRHVVVVPNATREGSDSTRNNDLVCVERLRERVAAQPAGVDATAITYVDFDVNTASIRRIIEQTELVVTSRFHAMVAALALGVPPLVMGWSHKYEEVLEMFGCEANAVDFAEAHRALLPLVDRVLGETDEVRARIEEHLPAVRAAAEAQFDVLDRLPEG